MLQPDVDQQKYVQYLNSLTESESEQTERVMGNTKWLNWKVLTDIYGEEDDSSK